MKTFLLVVHVLTAITAFGSSFAFPFIGTLAQRERAGAYYLNKAIELTTSRLLVPVGMTQVVTGTLLIFAEQIDLTRNIWLDVAILIYIGAFAFVFVSQQPNLRRVLAMMDPSRGVPPPTEEIEAISRRLSFGGMALGAAILVIAVLMVWKPGGTVS